MALALERRRAVAHKMPIKEILDGQFVTPGGFNPNYVLTKQGLKLARVNLVATAVNTYVSSDGRYAFLVLDDGSGVIRAKAFQDTKALGQIKKGELVRVMGKIREYNKERYVVPEVVKRLEDPNMETLQRLEIVRFFKEWSSKRKVVFAAKKECASIEELREKVAGQGIAADEAEAILETDALEEETEEKKAEEGTQSIDTEQAREIVLKTIGELDKGEGVDYSAIMQTVGLPAPVAERAINELLSEGSCYEPRAGKIKII